MGKGAVGTSYSRRAGTETGLRQVDKWRMLEGVTEVEKLGYQVKINLQSCPMNKKLKLQNVPPIWTPKGRLM